MALILRGKTRCWICGQILDERDEVVAFPAFIGNRNDPMYPFSDAAVHSNCLASHPFAEDVSRRLAASKGPHAAKDCFICKRQITDPDDWYTLPTLWNVTDDVLKTVSGAQFHTSCIRTWARREEIGNRLVMLYGNEKWDWPSFKDDLMTIFGK